MCGIVGYVGSRPAVDVLLEGLRRLEYRGYDSAGIAVYEERERRLRRVRSTGKIERLAEKLREEIFHATVGIGHTRWASHGAPTEGNAHPHRSGPFVVVHNGIVENYWEIKQEIIHEGGVFTSDTDTEVIVKLVESLWSRGMDEHQAFRKTLAKIRGTYAIVMLCEHLPDRLYVARYESPVVIGVGEGEHYVASDIPALLPFTRTVLYLDDGDVAEVRRGGVRIWNREGKEVVRPLETVEWNPVLAEKGHYRHFMQKEIFEQPRAIADTVKPYVHPDTWQVHFPQATSLEAMMANARRICIVACGTSYHAGMVGRYLFEYLLGVPCEVEMASEFRYRHPVVGSDSLLIAISQSGETADTKGALMTGRLGGAMTCAVVNVLGSSLSRMSEAVVYTHAGPEIGVASTKTFTAQLAALSLLAAMGAQVRHKLTYAQEMIRSLLEIPRHMEAILADTSLAERWARQLSQARSLIYLGRHLLFPVALEGALKLKEISYIHAEGFAAGEMKHGPIALIDEQVPVICLVQRGDFFDKVKGSIEEARARGGKVYLIADEALGGHIGETETTPWFIPSTHELLTPLLFALPLQLIAYAVAVEKGTDVDQPRNLAKSVTVE